MLTGLENFNKAMQEAKENRDDSRFVLRLKGGETAAIHFLTDGKDLVIANFHPVQKLSSGGKPYTQEVYCGYGDEGVDCKYCLDVTNTTPIRRRINAYVWVYSLTHEDGKVEQVNAPRLFRAGPGNGGVFSNTLTSYLRKYTTLTDRDYEWGRQGKGKEDTSYTLIPDKVVALTDEQKASLQTLPPLGDLVNGSAEVSIPTTAIKQAQNAVPITDTPAVQSKPLLEKLRAQKASAPKLGQEL